MKAKIKRIAIILSLAIVFYISEKYFLILIINWAVEEFQHKRAIRPEKKNMI